MHAGNHSTVREGLLIGLLGGGAVALWWLVVDLLGGAPLATPNGLGQVFVLTTAWLGFHTYARTRSRVTPHYPIPWWATVGGALVGIGTMLVVAWSRHPALRRSPRQVPLADEVETPSAPPPRTGASDLNASCASGCRLPV